MDEIKEQQENGKETEQSAKDADPNGKKNLKTRTGSGYLKQLYSTARTTAGNTHSNFRNLTTFLVNFIPVDKVDASELQVRVYFEDSEIQALSKSIAQHGVLQPILVVQNGDRYKVIAGERRLRASKLAGLERIPARVLTSDDKTVHEVALRENLDRVDLHPIEEGEGYVSLLEAQAYTSYEAIAQAFGKPKSRITECIGFTKLPDTTKQELMQRNIKQRSALRKLLSTPPEQHSELIATFAQAGDEIDPALVAVAQPKNESLEKKPAVKKEAKPFAYTCDEKGVAVPGFRWKVGEGTERLQDYIDRLNAFLSDVKRFQV
ncbi:MAG: ParB/RepB/Spo0J family partition protein [Bdellovibrionota bacterium]